MTGQINPFMQNYQAGQQGIQQRALADEMRQRLVQSQTEQNTQLDTNKVDLIKGLLSNIPNMQGAFGGVGAGTIMEQFDPRLKAGLLSQLIEPNSFTRQNDQFALDQKSADVTKTNAGALASSAQAGMFQNPDGSVTQIENPQERIARMNNQGALQRTQITQDGLTARHSGRDKKTMYEEVTEEVRDPRTGRVTTRTRFVPIDAEPSVDEGGMLDAPVDMIDQNQRPDDATTQQALQDFEEGLTRFGFTRLDNGIKQQDGSYIFDVQPKDAPNDVWTFRVVPGKPPQRVR